MYSVKFNKSGNIKLGSIWSFSKLYGKDIITVNNMSCKGTCGKYCDGCKEKCYVKKSYRYPSVKLSHMRNTMAFRENLDKSFENLYLQIKRARNKPSAVRINQSGELESKKELIKWIELAEKFPNIPFYIYTKAYDIVNYVLNNYIIPNNFTINISIWHESGLECFMNWCKLPTVKAFVYCDDYDYSNKISFDSECMAYKGGKLNHEITCEKCKKCFNKNSKIIKCNEH